MQQYFANYPGGRNSALQFELFPNQAMAAVSSNETAFPWRDSTGYMCVFLFAKSEHSPRPPRLDYLQDEQLGD